MIWLRPTYIRLRPPRSLRAGFTMIELLVVIAIIAILAAVVFPVSASVRVHAQEAQVISNMKAIQAALSMYKLDEHGYPPTLGPVIIGNGNATQYAAMYPEWIRDRNAYGSPNLDLDDPSATLPVQVNPLMVAPLPPGASEPARMNGARMYAWDTMDGSVVGENYVLHYSRYRTTDRNDADYKRQLGYRNPPEDTVVTWNDTFVTYGDDPGPDDDRGDLLVLFLNGTVKKYNIRNKGIRDLNGAYWRLKPY